MPKLKCSKPPFTGHCTPRALPQDDYIILQGVSDRKERGNLHFYNIVMRLLRSFHSLAMTRHSLIGVGKLATRNS